VLIKKDVIVEKDCNVILKLAVLSSIFYIAIILALELSLMVIAHFRGSAGVFCTKGGWWLLYSLAWFAAFSVAWHLSPLIRK
jgi:hypothetical protein